MKKVYKFMKVGMIAGSFLLCNALSAQFTNGNIVVLQAGDGTPTYTGNVSSPAILQEFSPLGTPAFSVAIPTSSAGVTVTGNDITEGLITRSYDGHFIVIPGYNAASGTSNPSGASASVVPRGIAKVDPAGSFSVVVTTNTFYSDNITTDGIGSATADGNGNFWGCGHVSGITAFVYNGVTATTGSTILTSPPSQNTRAVAIYNGQLYYSTGSVTHGLFMVGTGTPTAPTTVSLAVGLGSPYQFALNPTGNTLYIADKTAGVQKWTFNAGSWSNNYTFSTTANSTKAIGLVADFSGTNPIIYATVANGASLVAIADGGSLATSTITTLATAPINTTFRGVAFSPTCIATSITFASGSGCTGSPLGLNVTASGTSPLSYTWTGAGTISNANIASPIVTGFSGSYSVTVKNACGTAASTVVIPTNSSPTLSAINNINICTGNAIALTPTLTPNAAGASYTLTTQSGATPLSVALAAMTAAPAGTYPCTLTAQDAVGCISNSQAFIVTIDLCTGIIKYGELATTISPNPAKESVEILFVTTADKNINIINSLGQTVFNRNTNDKHLKLDVSGFPQGVYFVSIISGNQKEIKKLIVQ